jgi:Ca2+-binding RTX toxin-like protein
MLFMNNYEMLYQNALLADAAYIDFSQYNISGGVLDKNNGPLRKEFLDRGFTDQQIDDFFVRYEIKHYQPNNSSGFSATAFVDKKVEPNKITVSFRGTEPPNLEDTSSFGNFFADLKQDLLLAKGVSELNPFSQDNYIEAFLYELEVIDGSGSVLSGYEQGINIVGHSLGGYLAAMAAVDNPELIDQVYTYNGAGLTGLDLVYNGFVKPHLLGKNLDQSRFHNFYAEPGYEITAGQAGSDYLSRFWRPGSRTPLFIEGQGDVGIANHSMIHLVNALSVGRLLAYLDETKTIEFVDNLLWQASNKAVELRHDNGITQGAVSLDSTVRNLSTLLGGGFLAYSTTNDAADFYLALKASNAEFRLLSSEDVISLAASFSGEDTQQTPETRAVMYALLEGIPFSLVPLNGYADGIFSDTTDNEKYDASRYSEAFIRDKSDHLSYLMARNKADIDSDFDARESTNLNAEDTFYLDLSRRQNDLSVGGTVIGNPSDDTRNIIFGTDGVDDTTNGAFDGSKNNDRLYGMGGDDKLFGRKGDDYLEGGKGNDTFYFSAEDGYDRIGDTQFEEGDKIVLNVGGNGFDIASYSFSQSSDETSYVGTLNNNNSAPVLSLLLNGTGLLITARDSSGSIINNIEVDNFSDGDFGLSLASANESDDVSQGGNFLEIGSGEDLIIGEQEYPFFTAASYLHQDVRGQAGLGFHYNASDYYSDEVLFEYSQDPSKFEWVGKYYIRPTRGYHFYGSINKDRLIGGNQSDALFGGGEDDRLEGRGGHDTLFGGSGSDQIIGGSGNDVLFGAYTPDYVLDKDSNIVDVVDVPSSVQDPVARDEISGGDGSDLISGSHSVDIISGGGDADMIGGGLGGDDIYGGAGNDRIFGDSVFANRRIDGSDRSIIVDGYHPVHHVLIEGLISHQANPDELSTDDVIDGGTGNDVIWGEKGKDIINGGEGTDFIFGDRNNTPDFRGTTYDELNDLNQLSDFVRSYFDVTQTDGFYQHNFAVNLTQFEDISQWHDDDIINGGAGSDYIEGNGGSDTIHGNDGDDQIRGDDDTLDLAQHKGDTLHGDAGVDTIWGNGGNDKIHGGSESDWLYGGEHDDEIKGGAGNDLIYGDANDEDNEHQGADTLIGNSGDDLIYGEGGNDTLIGGVGNDVLNGGEGNDSYLFSVGDGVDALSDSDGQSTLVFHAVGLHDLSIINSDYLYIVYGDGDVIAIDAGSANAIDSIEVGGSHYTVSEVISELALSNESWSLSYSGGFNTQSRQVTQIVSGNIGGSEFVESFSSDLTGNVSAYGFTTTSLDQNEHAIESGVGHANIIGIQGSVTNSSAQFYIGDERDNIIVGDFNRRNIIDGGTGNDTLWGGQLSDIYYVDSENDVITGEFTNQFYGANTDKVVSTAD